MVGGGAAGFFAAITCAEASPDTEVMVLERSPQFLAKVRISGGGRCNVTHACFDPREFTTRYPRGERELIGPFQNFSAADTVAWFAARGVRLKTESDGRMFPTTDSSQTIIECLLRAAQAAKVKLVAMKTPMTPLASIALAMSSSLSCMSSAIAITAPGSAAQAPAVAPRR